LAKGRDIAFRLEASTVESPLKVMWKVKNTGEEATSAGQLRGSVVIGDTSRYEHTAYAGSHYVEVYIVKDGVCVAIDRQPVIIPPKTGL